MTLLTQYVCRDHRRQSVPSLIVFCCLAATATFLITGGMARATEVEFLFAFGTQGTGNGQFTFPYGIAVGNSGNIYVTDTEQHRVQVFDSDGNFQSAFGSTGTAEGDFDGPTGIAVGNGGDIYVADSNNRRVQIFDSSGNFKSAFGSFGFGNGEFSRPTAIAAAVNGDIYVTDGWQTAAAVGRVQVFNSLGAYQSTIGSFGSGRRAIAPKVICRIGLAVGSRRSRRR